MNSQILPAPPSSNLLQKLTPPTRRALLKHWEVASNKLAGADDMLSKCRVVRISIEDLTANEAQDKDLRETVKRLDSLINSILVSGVIAPILVVKVGDIYYIIDGHRRTAAARILGLTSIDAIVVKQEHLDASVLFAILNSGALKFTGDMWFSGWALTSAKARNEFLDRMDTAVRADIRRFIRLVQDDDIVVKIGKGVRETGVPTPKPNISSVIEKLYLNIHAANPSSRVTVKDVVRWAISPMRYTNGNGNSVTIDNNYTTLSDWFKKAKNLDNTVVRSVARSFEGAVLSNSAIEVLVDDINHTADARTYANELPLAKF